MLLKGWIMVEHRSVVDVRSTVHACNINSIGPTLSQHSWVSGFATSAEHWPGASRSYALFLFPRRQHLPEWIDVAAI